MVTLNDPLARIDPDDPYPESDGAPMAENTLQFDWIVKLKENLEILYADRPDVFVAGDLLWYPDPDRHVIGPLAPDAMVVYHPDGTPFRSPVELAQLAREAGRLAAAERARAERLAERLRVLGIDPEAANGD